MFLIKKRIKSVLTKNMLSRLLVAMMLFSLLQPLFVSPDVASAEAATDDFTTIPRDGYSDEVVITDYTGSDKDVVIPSTIDGKKVTIIGGYIEGVRSGAFQSKNLSSVTIPYGVLEIGVAAFQENDLSTVTIPNSVTTISDGAFRFNPSLTVVTIPASVTNIGIDVFYVPNHLDKLTIIGEAKSAAETYASNGKNSHKFLVLPAPPTNLQLTTGDSQVNLTWDTTTADSIKIYMSEVGGNYSEPPLDTVTAGNSYTATGLNNGTTYYFVVKASNDDGGESDASNEVSGTPTAASQPPASNKKYGVYAFGYGGYDGRNDGYLGLGDNIEQTTPKLIVGLNHVKQAVAAQQHSLVLTNDGVVFSFGRNDNGQLGLGDVNSDGEINNNDISVVVKEPREIKFFSEVANDKAIAIAANTYSSFVLMESGDVYSFGNGNMGLGYEVDRMISDQETSRYQMIPKKIEEYYENDEIVSVKAKAIAAGESHALILDDKGDIYSVGFNDNGQLGQGDKTPRTYPTKINAAVKFTAIAADADHSLAIDKNKVLNVFGNNSSGQLVPYLSESFQSISPTYDGYVKVIATGYNHSLLIRDYNGVEVTSYGSNQFGQLGGTPNYNSVSPINLHPDEKVIGIDAGIYYSLLLTEIGDVYSFGIGTSGQLGHGDKVNQPTPKKIEGIKDAIGISAGFSHSLVVAEIPTQDNGGDSGGGGSNGGGSGSGSSSGGGSSNSGSTTNSEQITVDVETGKLGQEIVNQTPITRSREANGIVHDQVTLTPERTGEAIKSILSAGQNTARFMIPDAKDEVARTDFTVPRAVAQQFSNENVNLEIYTENVRIQVPESSLKDVADDLYFRLVPIKEEPQRKDVEERARVEQMVLSIAQGQNVNVVARPITIETNLQSRPVTLVLPLRDVVLPTDAKEREQFLADLVIFIEHSDGEKQLVKPEVVEYKNGQLGLQFGVNKFSTFTILNMDGWEEHLKAQEEAKKAENQSNNGNSHNAYVKGFVDGTFKPNQTITRAEMATILARNLGYDPAKAVTSSYPDLKANHWALKPIEFIKETGLMVGDNQGNFRPDAPISRGEMAAIAARYKKLATPAITKSVFNDVAANHWAAVSIESVQKAGIVGGYTDGTFKPAGKLTRAEVVKIVNRLFNRGPLFSVTKPNWPDVPTTHWAYYEIEEASQDHTFEVRSEGGENLVK